MKITIFGLAGTGKSSVGKKLAADLGYQFRSSGDMVRAKAREMGLTLPELQELCEKDPKYDHELDAEMKKFGEENDNFVVESRLAWHFIPDSVKIKLDCDFDERVRRVAQRDEITFEAAHDHVVVREKTDDARYKMFYNIDNINDDGHFDLAVDTTSIPVEEVVRKIKEFLSGKGL